MKLTTLSAITTASALKYMLIAVLIVVTSIISFPGYSYAGLVIRGGQCSVDAFENGAAFVQDGYITGLSVNYTDKTSDKADYQGYLTGIGGYNQYCVATSGDIEKVGVIQLDPTKTNKLHALLNGKSKALAGKLTKYPM